MKQISFWSIYLIFYLYANISSKFSFQRLQYKEINDRQIWDNSAQSFRWNCADRCSNFCFEIFSISTSSSKYDVFYMNP